MLAEITSPYIINWLQVDDPRFHLLKHEACSLPRERITAMRARVWLTKSGEIAVVVLRADGRSQSNTFTAAEWDSLVEWVGQLRATSLRGYRAPRMRDTSA